jgi:hypothetical protein
MLVEMVDLTSSQLNALRNLSLKQTGAPVPFINIAAARTLTELGLATRSREGWEITRAGITLLAVLEHPPA